MGPNLDSSKLGRKLKKIASTSQFSDMTSSSNFFWSCLFLLITLVTSPIFMSTLSLVLESWQFPVIRDWREIRKSEIPPSEFYPISRDWDELGITDLARMSLIKCLLNAAKCLGYSSYSFWVIKGKPTGR